MDNPDHIEVKGKYKRLTDKELDRLVGIDDDGNIKPEVLALALRDALKHDPRLYALMVADTE